MVSGTLCRITLAMRGTKEERSILIRDSTKLVALAVLDSPKVSDGEVEKFALQKNVLEAVLRAIPMRRRYQKNYNIMRNLVQNPRTPLDLSLGLMKNLLVHDLKNLSSNKEVSDTVRKLALRSEASLANENLGASLQAVSRDGTVLTANVPIPPGNMLNPAGDAELTRKFLVLSQGVLGRERAQRAVEAILAVDTMPDLGGLLTALAPARRCNAGSRVRHQRSVRGVPHLDAGRTDFGG